MHSYQVQTPDCPGTLWESINVNTLSSNANNDIHFFAVHQIILNLKQVSAAAYSFLSDISARK